MPILNSRRITLRNLSLAALPAFALLHPALSAMPAKAATDGIGVAAAVNPDATGQPPAMDKRIIEVGTNMVVDEKIVTGPNGQAQLIFRDGSAFSIGPNSELTLDKFVYDPAKGNGEIALSVTKGVFRFVGGKISKDNPVQIKAGSATMGIRGGIATLNVNPGQPVVARFLFGREMSMTQNGLTQVTTRPGTAIDVPPGAPPSPPRAVSAQEMRESSSQLEAGGGQQQQQEGGQGGGQAGGAPPSGGAIESRLDSSGVSNSNSAPPPGGIAPVGPPPPPAQRANAAPGGMNQQAQNSASQSVNNNQASNSNQAAQNQYPPHYNVVFSPLSGLTGRFLVGNGSAIEPFSGFDGVNYNINVSPEYSQSPTQYAGATNGSQFRATVMGTSAVPGQTTLTLPSQTGFFSLYNITNPYGTFNGIGYATGSRDFFYYALQSGPNLSMLVTAGKPTNPTNFSQTGLAAYNVLGGLNSIPLIGEVVPQADMSRGNAIYSPLYAAYNPHLTPTEVGGSDQRSVMLQASIGISGQGSSQSSFMAGTTAQFGVDTVSNEVVALGGVTGSYRRSGNSNAPIALRSDLSTLAVNGQQSAVYGNHGEYMVLSSDNLTANTGTGAYDRTSQVGVATPLEYSQPFDATFFDVAVRSPSTPTILSAPARTTQVQQGYASALLQRMDMGNNLLTNDVVLQSQNGSPLDVMLTTDASTNRAQATFNLVGGSSPYTLQFGNAGGSTEANSAFINDKLYALRESTTSVTTVESQTATRVNSLLVSSNVASVDSSFLPYGVNFCTDCDGLSWGWWLTNIKRADNGYVENAHLATYVTGVLPTLGTLPQTGTARFGGHAIGNVQNGNARYVAVGNFDAAWNFGSRNGMFKISNFDSLDLNGNGTAGNGRDFYGSLSGMNLGGSFAGSFFSGDSDPARYMGGQFTINGMSYTAAGTFAAGSNASAAVTDLYAQGWRGRYLRYNFDSDNPSNSQNPYTSFNNMSLAVTPESAYNAPIIGGSLIGNQWVRITTVAGDFFFKTSPNQFPMSVGYSNVFSPFDTNITTQEGLMYYPPSQLFFFASLADSTNPFNSRTVVYGGLPTTFAQFPTTGLAAHELLHPGLILPFIPQDLSSDLLSLGNSTSVSPIYSAYNPTITGAGTAASPQRSVFLQASIGIYGQGSSQQSIMMGSTGVYIQEGTQQSVMLTGGLRGSIRNDASDGTLRLAGGVASASTGDGNAIYGPNSEHMVLVPDGSTYNSGTQLNTRNEQAAFMQPHDDLPGQDYYYTVVANRQDTPSPVLTTPSRSNLSLNGYAAGMVERRDGTSMPMPDVMLTSGSNPTGVSVATNATTNRAQASFALTDAGNAQNYNMQFGGLTGSHQGSSSFINDALFGMRESAATSSQVNGVDVNARGLMVTHQVAEIGSSALPSGVSLCNCEYLQWGWWISDINHNDPMSSTQGQRDRVHMASWVAGELADVADFTSMTGTASFSGHAAANVNNNGSRYVAIGSFNQTWNFATKSGSVSITNFDNIAPISGSVFAANGRDFTGALSATGGYTGSLNGSFFKGGVDPAAASGGNFTLVNTGYNAAGTFAAQKQP